MKGVADLYYAYRLTALMCTKKIAQPYQREVQKMFELFQREWEKKGSHSKKNWDTIKNEGWEQSTVKVQKWLKREGQAMVNLYESFSMSKRSRLCKREIMPKQLQGIRVMRKSIENRGLSKKIEKEDRF